MPTHRTQLSDGTAVNLTTYDSSKGESRAASGKDHPAVRAIVSDIEKSHPTSDGYPANPVTVGNHDGFVTLKVAGSKYHEGSGDGAQYFLVYPNKSGASVITAKRGNWEEAMNTQEGHRHHGGYERIASRAMK
jgi:hypothetical protein